MGATILMYVLPMMLGQTYHLGKDQPGLQIFPADVENNTVTVQQYFTDSQYRMVDNSDQIRDFLSAGGHLSLRVKGGQVSISGEGSYIRDIGSLSNGIEILVKVHFETITKTIPSSFQPRADWTLLNKKFLGTHYCRSITYGGDLIASIRITGSSSNDLMHIKAAINGGINAGKGSFEANLKGKLDMLKQSALDSSSMEINYYATVPLHGVSYDIDGLMKLVNDFPEQVKMLNNGTGNPLRMELYPLSSLSDAIPQHFENRAINYELNDMESQFDDLRDTRRRIGNWISALPPDMPDDVTEKIQAFSNKVNKIYGVYLQSISDLDTSQGASTKPILDAFEAYKAGEYILPQKYFRQFNLLQKSLYLQYPELKPRIGGGAFHHWGRSDCGTADTEANGVGAIATSQLLQNGASSEFLCVPTDLVRVHPEDYFPEYSAGDDKENHLLISPIRSGGELKQFKSMLNKPMACVKCRSGHRTAVLTMMASRSCPSDQWTKEYEGIMMSSSKLSSKGDFICMDVGMQNPTKQVAFGTTDTSRWNEIHEVVVECGALPCEPYKINEVIPCVVCTI